MMEQASVALAKLDYLACERRCLEALALARKQANWSYYARVLMPLQESRRQRRMISAEGTIRLGTAKLANVTSGCVSDECAIWLERLDRGCIVVTPPYTTDDAHALAQNAKEKNRFVEVLFAESVPDDAWTLCSYAGPKVHCRRPAPPDEWCERWLEPNPDKHVNPHDMSAETATGLNPNPQPADWFLDACEALGDAALAQVEPSLSGPLRVETLEQCLHVVADHEILHQRLGDAARAADIG